MTLRNLLTPLPRRPVDEVFETLLQQEGLRLERIVSVGHATPPGEWYDQQQDEWVLLMQGAARLRLEDPAEVFELQPGDSLMIPAHRRHRVEWTQPDAETIWLALHVDPQSGSQPES
ncbi:Cupin domain protein [Maioricimonas rarisocia]|uniref:Cupin domain protein n=1 Tax=Maioricimonas rarisocia TaxID=2528026 RepID=A0A517Z2V2_9PLAN|nr:cupin domain-containing protein [Maioricimonas rarisocia]QDU36824.1 Cupin domain protein [Maioricimonas rarisocia]